MFEPLCGGNGHAPLTAQENRPMKKISITLTLVLFIVGCGTQNENLAKGKELIKSDKRRKEERAVREFKLALQQQTDSAEAHYLLGLYNSQGVL